MQYRLISRQDAADVKVSLFGLLVITAFLMLIDPFLHRLWPLEALIPGFDPASQYNWVPALLAIAMCASLSKNSSLDMSATIGRAPSDYREVALYILAGLTVFLCLLSTQILLKGVASITEQMGLIHDPRAGILHVSVTADRFKELPLGFWLASAVKIITTPVYEELVFRGLILRKLLQTGRPFTAVIISAIIFGAVHFDGNMLYATLAGLVFGYLYYRTGSLWITVIAHAVANSLSMVVGSILGVFVTPQPEIYGWNYTITTAVLIAILIPLLAVFITERLYSRTSNPVADCSATGRALPIGNTTDVSRRRLDL